MLKAMSQVATVITSLDDAVTRTITPFKVTKNKIVCFSGSTKCSTKQIGAFYKAPIDLCDKLAILTSAEIQSIPSLVGSTLVEGLNSEFR